MLLKLPERVPLPATFAVCGLLVVAQVLEGTSVFVAGLCFLFLLFSVLGFNLSGGMVYPSGSYIAACSLLTVGLCMFVKAALGETFERNLVAPEKTMLVYTAGMASMLAAAYVNTRIRPKRALLQGLTLGEHRTKIAIGCMVVAIGVPYILPGEYYGTFQQGNYFILFAIVIPVFENLRRTNGRRSFNFISLIAWSWTTAFGILSFSKLGIFQASLTWAAAAVAAGYRASFAKLVMIAVVGAVAVGILTPYSQIGRVYGRDGGLDTAVAVAVILLSHPLDTREQYAAESEFNADDETNFHMFDEPMGIFDRLNMFSIDNALVAATDKGSKAKPGVVWSYFVNLIPRYVYPNKPKLLNGNLYAHEIGLLGEDDDTTGISFSPFAEGYHTGQWIGVTATAFCVWLFGFWMMDAVGGSAKFTVWPLVYIIYNMHGAAEGMLAWPIYGGGTVSFFLILVAYLCARLVPMIGGLLSASSQPGLGHVDATGRRVQSV